MPEYTYLTYGDSYIVYRSETPDWKRVFRNEWNSEDRTRGVSYLSYEQYIDNLYEDIEINNYTIFTCENIPETILQDVESFYQDTNSPEYKKRVATGLSTLLTPLQNKGIIGPDKCIIL